MQLTPVEKQNKAKQKTNLATQIGIGKWQVRRQLDKLDVVRLPAPGKIHHRIVKQLAETALKLLSVVPKELW